MQIFLHQQNNGIINHEDKLSHWNRIHTVLSQYSHSSTAFHTRAGMLRKLQCKSFAKLFLTK